MLKLTQYLCDEGFVLTEDVIRTYAELKKDSSEIVPSLRMKVEGFIEESKTRPEFTFIKNGFMLDMGVADNTSLIISITDLEPFLEEWKVL